jgi:type IV secretory pathway VirJ component
VNDERGTMNDEACSSHRSSFIVHRSFCVLLVAFAVHAQLPLVEKPVTPTTTPYFVVLLTGDGGWRKIDIELAREINLHGIPVVGFLSNRYFATERTPEEVARDVQSVIAAYAAKWRKAKPIVIGYSRGAEAVPIALSQMEPQARAKIALAAILGPEKTAELRVRRWWMFGLDAAPPEVLLAPLVHASRGVRLLCFYGADEGQASLCPMLPAEDAVAIRTPGGHHFGGAYRAIARAILDALPTP